MATYPNAGDPTAGGLSGFLSGALENPLIGLGLGVLGAPRGATFGQRLGQGVGTATDLRSTALRNRGLREDLVARKTAREEELARRAAWDELLAMLGGGGTSAGGTVAGGGAAPTVAGGPVDLLSGFPGLSSDGPVVGAGPVTPPVPGVEAGAPNQAGILSLLARAQPEAFAQGILGQIFAKQQGRELPSDVRTLIAAGIDPRSPEGQELLKRSIAGQDISGQLAQLEVMQTQLEIQRQQQAIEDARAKADAAAREGRSLRGTLRNEIYEQISLGREAATLMTELEGTFGQTGFGGDFRSGLAGATALAQDMFGKGSTEAKNIAGKMERLNQIGTSFGLENFEVFTGSLSDRDAAIALGKDFSINKTSPANRQALADRLSLSLSQADVEGIEVPDRAELEALIAELRRPAAASRGGGSPAAGAAAPAPAGSDPLGLR